MDRREFSDFQKYAKRKGRTVKDLKSASFADMIALGAYRESQTAASDTARRTREDIKLEQAISEANIEQSQVRTQGIAGDGRIVRDDESTRRKFLRGV